MSFAQRARDNGGDRLRGVTYFYTARRPAGQRQRAIDTWSKTGLDANKHLVLSLHTCCQLGRQTYQHRQDGAQHRTDLRATSSHFCETNSSTKQTKTTNSYRDDDGSPVRPGARRRRLCVVSQPSRLSRLAGWLQQLASSAVRPDSIPCIFPSSCCCCCCCCYGSKAITRATNNRPLLACVV